MYQKTGPKQALQEGAFVWGSFLANNTATAQTILSSQLISILYTDITSQEAFQINQIVNSISRTNGILIGTFTDDNDPFLKQKLDAGLHGAILRLPQSINQGIAFLERLKFPPLGTRPAGPSPASGYLQDWDNMVNSANSLIIGGITIGINNIQLVKDLISIKPSLLDLILVEDAHEYLHNSNLFSSLLELTKSAKIPLGIISNETSLFSDPNNLNKFSTAGFTHFVIHSDMQAFSYSFRSFSDIPLNRSIEPYAGENNSSSKNQIKTWWDHNLLVHLGFLMTYDLKYASILSSQYNGLWIDAEHGTFSESQIESLIHFLRPITNVVLRVGRFDHPFIERFGGSGIQGIICPSVNNGEESREFIQRVRKFPNVVAIVMIETKEAVYEGSNLQDIMESKPDLIHLGPFDLSLSMGVPMGSTEHKEALELIRKTALKHGLYLGSASQKRSLSYQNYDIGFRFLTSMDDQGSISMFYKSFQTPSKTLSVLTKTSQKVLSRYVTPVVIPSEVGWVDLGNGTITKLYSYGDQVSVQWVSKSNVSIGQKHDLVFTEGYITLMLTGKSRIEVGETRYDLFPGDIVFLPNGQKHSFIDMSPSIELINIFVPHKYQIQKP